MDLTYMATLGGPLPPNTLVCFRFTPHPLGTDFKSVPDGTKMNSRDDTNLQNVKASKNSFHSRIHFYLLTAIIILLVSSTHQRNWVWQNSIILWEDIVKKSPKKGRVHNNLSIAYLNAGLNEKAFKEINISIDLDPKDYRGYNCLGIAYISLGQSNDAILAFKKAIKIEPSYFVGHFNLGRAYLDKGEIPEAIREFQIALKLEPGDPKVYNNLGLAYIALGQLDKAVVAFENAIKIWPDYTGAQKNLDSIVQKANLRQDGFSNP